MEERKIKFLTLYMGRPWHEIIEDKPGLVVQLVCNCGQIMLAYSSMERHIKTHNRTFKVDDDRRDLLRMMWRKEDWNDFDDFCYIKWRKIPSGIGEDDIRFTYWLTLDESTVEQVCELAYEFLSKERV